MARAYDETDLQNLCPRDLQAALLGVPDDLIAQALTGAPAGVRSCLTANLSRRRKSEVLRRAARLEEELGERARRSALRNLVRRVFSITGPEAGAAEASERVGPAGRARPPGEEPAEGTAKEGRDLIAGAFGRLREARGIVSAFGGLSGYAKHLAGCRRGMGGAVLVRSWLGREPAVPRERIYAAICGQGADIEKLRR